MPRHTQARQIPYAIAARPEWNNGTAPPRYGEQRPAMRDLSAGNSSSRGCRALSCYDAEAIVACFTSLLLAQRSNLPGRRAGTQAGDCFASLVLLRHSIRTSRRWRIWPQQGHRGSVRTRIRARRRRKVAIELGMWRWVRSGSTSGSVTSGNGRLHASPGPGTS